MKRIKNILSIIAVVLFMGYYASTTMFSHTHQFEWGRVTHSHPYVPQGGHSHSAATCSLIHNVSTTLFIASTVAFVVALFASAYHYNTLCVRDIQASVVPLYDLRAPPVC